MSILAAIVLSVAATLLLSGSSAFHLDRGAGAGASAAGGDGTGCGPGSPCCPP